MNPPIIKISCGNLGLYSRFDLGSVVKKFLYIGTTLHKMAVTDWIKASRYRVKNQNLQFLQHLPKCACMVWSLWGIVMDPHIISLGVIRLQPTQIVIPQRLVVPECPTFSPALKSMEPSSSHQVLQHQTS